MPTHSTAPKDSNLDEQESRAFCHHVRAAQRSEGARLRSPWLAGRGSTLQSDEVTAGTGRGLVLRMRAGVGFSLNDWLRADILEEQAEALCAAHRAEVGLRRDMDANLEAITKEGWARKVVVLRAALERGQKLLVQSRAELANNQRTVTQHLRTLNAYQLLHEELATARGKLADLEFASPPQPPDPRLAEQLVRSVSALERSEGALRRNSALNVTLEAGYDELLGISQDLPLYGQVNASFRLGSLWQSKLDQQSTVARAEAARLDLARQRQAYVELVERALARRPLLAAELEQRRQYARNLSKERDSLLKTQHPDATVLAQHLWFDVRLEEAECARLEVSLAALDRWLQQQPAEVRRRLRSAKPVPSPAGTR